MQRAWLHGVAVDAPAAWSRNAVHCGRPTRDTFVVFPSGEGTEDCLMLPKPDVSAVWLGAYDAEPLRKNVVLGEVALGRRGLAGLTATQIAGETARVGTFASINGGTAHLVVFPQRRAYVTVRSRDARLVTTILHSIQLADVDPATNCRVHTAAYDHPTRLPPQPGHTLVPATPSSVTACAYVDDWLEQTATLTGAPLERLVVALKAAPRPTNAHAPEDWPGCRAVDARFPFPAEPMALRFHYPDGTRLLVARIVWCTRWQSYVTTGNYTRRITPELLNALPGVWTSFPTPNTMRLHRRRPG